MQTGAHLIHWILLSALSISFSVGAQSVLHADGFEGGTGGGSVDSLNPGLSGSLLLVAPGSFAGGGPFSAGAVVELLIRMDIRSGRYQRLPNSRWRERFPESDDIDFTVVAQSYRRGLLALTVDDCQRIGDQCVATVDADGRYLAVVKMTERIAEPARLSADGRHFVVVENLLNGPHDLGIYTINGKLVSYGQEVHILAEPKWLPDNRLLFRDNALRAFRYSSPLSVKPATRRTLPASATGTIRGFSISPDGQTVAFVLQRSEIRSDRELWTMGLNTGELRRVARQASSDHYLFGPTWSPDGSYILIQLISGPPALLAPRSAPWLFAVPPRQASVQRIGPANTSSPGIIQLKRIKLRRDNDEKLVLQQAVDSFDPQTFRPWHP